MKTMTCKQMGGMCDAVISAPTSDEMIEKGMVHLRASHPEMIASIESMPHNDPMMVAWYTTFKKTWDDTPEDKSF